ncbi:exosome catalytic subunit dis3 [Perkinsus chesapeaki]|uniref:Ribosomal RNA-processing protein 44 n=1 Tax=Perkinsus chesapeaki TaxID=330153 RepID=A0A7J6MC71_PERCH|nr:exosome catalytic subunit dis3 [Perkinsus chesapeaki]
MSSTLIPSPAAAIAGGGGGANKRRHSEINNNDENVNGVKDDYDYDDALKATGWQGRMSGYDRLRKRCNNNTTINIDEADNNNKANEADDHSLRAVDNDIVAVELIDDNNDEVDEDGGGGIDSTIPVLDASTATEALEERVMDKGGCGDDSGSGIIEKEGKVVGIIKRNWREYAGTLRSSSSSLIVDDNNITGGAGGGFSKMDRIFIPANPRIPNIRISTRHSNDLDNMRICVTMDTWDRTSTLPQGHWTRILGKCGERDTESAVILHEHNVITRQFSDDVIRCLPPKDYEPDEAEISRRLDLRNITVCSIDPPGCKDIDDALSCEILENGNWRIGVHIADVTHFVHPGTAIDKEAAERCTTVYLVERRTDMLPSLLTTDLCSLVGIRRLLKAAMVIRKNRMSGGALELASQEVRFELDSETSDPTDVAEYTMKDTNRLVEEFMLLANSSVAQQILKHFPSNSVLRRHPPPKEQQLKSLKVLLDKQGIHGFKYGSNKELSHSLNNLCIKDNDPYFNRLVRIMTTRTMNQAQYFCTGDVDTGGGGGGSMKMQMFSHYGLAMGLYTHFTSPIRRYADILVHRLLMASLGIRPLPDELNDKTAVTQQCDKINFRHRNAQFAGRASAELHTYLYFKKNGPSVADAVITRIRSSSSVRRRRRQQQQQQQQGGVSGGSLQVVVPRFGIDGICKLMDDDDNWECDEDKMIAKNDKLGIKLSIFDHIQVKIMADDTDFR